MSTESRARELARGYLESFANTLKQSRANTTTAPDVDPLTTVPMDVVVNTFPKSGTTLLQQMTYQIAVASGGAPEDDPTGLEFDDIVLAVPWFEMMDKFKLPLSKTTPTIYKTHKNVSSFKNVHCKHIATIRDPTKFSGSMLNFMFKNIVKDVDEESLSEEIKKECVAVINEQFLLSALSPTIPIGAWHSFAKDCYEQSSTNVLILCYEDIVKDLKKTVERVSKFMGVQITDEQVEKVAGLCDQSYMSDDPKFDGHYAQKAMGSREKPRHTFPEGYRGFKGFPVPAEQLKKFEELNLNSFGVKSYEEIRRMINTQQQELHGY